MNIPPPIVQSKSTAPRFLFIKIDGKYLKICYPDILYIEAVNKYIKIVTRKKWYLVSATMHDIENILPPDLFCRIHRSYIISLEHTEEFDNEFLYIDKKELPIGKHYRASLCSKVITIYSDPVKSNPPIENTSGDLLKKIS